MTGLDVPPLLQGRYELGPVLGVGGMATVYRGRDRVLERAVAIKVFGTDADAARIRDESRALAALNHPGLVAVYDAGVTDDAGTGPAYLVMELIDGPTLARCCLDGSLRPLDVARVGADLAEALAHVHERGLVHRDVKPANILLTPSGRGKLTDFGIARLVDGARHTATGTTVGTAPYLSPEQVTGRSIGAPADVYALGLVLLECLTGQREYDGHGVEAALARLHRPPRVPSSLPAPWPGLLLAMTDSDPDRRPSAAAVATALRTGVPAPDTGHPSTRPARTRPRARPSGAPTALLTDAARYAPRAPGQAPARPPRSPARRPDRRWVLPAARDALANRAVLAALAVLATVIVAVSVALTVSAPGPAAQPQRPATSPLERDLQDLHQAVSP